MTEPSPRGPHPARQPQAAAPCGSVTRVLPLSPACPPLCPAAPFVFSSLRWASRRLRFCVLFRTASSASSILALKYAFRPSCGPPTARVSHQAQSVRSRSGGRQATRLAAALRRSRDRPHGRTSDCHLTRNQAAGGCLHASRPGWQAVREPGEGGRTLTDGPTSGRRLARFGSDAAVVHVSVAKHGEPGPWALHAAAASPAGLARGCPASPAHLLAVRRRLCGAATCTCRL